jgi:hypothetical protein
MGSGVIAAFGRDFTAGQIFSDRYDQDFYKILILQ